MNLSKPSIQGLGFMGCAALVAATFLLVIQPLGNAISTDNKELVISQDLTALKVNKLGQLESKINNVDQAKQFVNTFLTLIPTSKDVESISRSISNAMVPGISLTAFNFGNAENVLKMKAPVSNLGSYQPPFDLEKSSSGTSSGEGAPAAVNDFNRIPVAISVTASSNSNLAQYVSELANQNRLLYVVSVDSARSAQDGGVAATIYAYAYAYAN